MSDGLIIHDAAHRHALQRLVSTSRRASVDVMKAEAKQLFTLVAKMTPPASQGTTGKAAERQGVRKVRADIRSIYGGLGDAYDVIDARLGKRAAEGFWKHAKARDWAKADVLLQSAIGKRSYDFDNGRLHQRMRGRRGTVNRPKQPMIFLRDTDALDPYITSIEAQVWWLAGGWAPALQTLGAKLPYGIGKHSQSPGDYKISTGSTITITAINRVGYADQVAGMERRIRSAMKIRTDVLQRRWDAYMQRRNNTGFKVTPGLARAA